MSESKEDKILKIKLDDVHTKKYLDNLYKKTYKGKKVVFVLLSGKKIVYEK